MYKKSLLLLLSINLIACKCILPDPVITRYGVKNDLKMFPQDNPRMTLRSIIKAIELKRFDYLLAHLIYPDLIKIELGSDSFENLVLHTRENFTSGKKNADKLREFLKDGILVYFGRQAAVIRLQDGSQIQFMEEDDLWYMNRH